MLPRTLFCLGGSSGPSWSTFITFFNMSMFFTVYSLTYINATYIAIIQMRGTFHAYGLLTGFGAFQADRVIVQPR